MRPHILLITTTNLASNPRCLKELNLLLSMDFQVTLVGFHYNNWTSEKEKLLNLEYKEVTFHYLDATKKQFTNWLFSSFLEKLARVLSPLFPANRVLTSIAVSKRSWSLIKWMKKWKKSPDFIIGHNPGAFYPCSYLANKLKIPFALDVEDFHPGEMDNVNLQNNLIRIIRNHLPECLYVSFASPLIKSYTAKLLEANHPKFITLNNCFSKSEFLTPLSLNKSNKLQLVWFSQYIDYTRGLEFFLPLLDKYSNDIELTLIGDCRKDFYENEIRKRRYIIYQTPLPQKELHVLLAKYDIGLAIEDKTCDVNKDICLTNKVWAYFQAGLYIIASDTQSQKLFIEKHTDHGICISLQDTFTENYIGNLIKEKTLIRLSMFERYKNAQEYSWDKESEKLKKHLKFLSAGKNQLSNSFL